MNGKQITILYEALNQINDELYEQLPLTYADKASKIIKTVIGKMIKRYLNKDIE